MQGQRATVESLHEGFEFESGSTSSNSVMVGSPICWNDMLSNQNMTAYFLSPNEINLPYVNSENLDPVGMSMGSWNFSDPSSSGQESVNQNGVTETKMEHQWTGSNESRTVNNGMPLLGNADTIFGGSRNTSELVPSRNLDLNILENLNNTFRNPDHNTGSVGSSGPASGVNIHSDSRAFGSDAGIVPSGNSSAITCGTVTCENGTADCDGRQSSLIDGRFLSCKRKNIDVPGCSSGGPSSSFLEQDGSSSVQILSSHRNSATDLDISRSSEDYSVVNPADALNPQIGSGVTAARFSRSARIVGSSHRNVRMRMTPAEHPDISISNSDRVSNPLGPPHILPNPPPLYTPFYQMGMGMASTNAFQTHPSVVPGFLWPTQPLPWSARPSISSVLPSVLGDGFIAPREEINPSRSTISNNISRPAIFVPGNSLHVPQEPVNWSTTSSNGSSQGNIASLHGAGSSVEPLIPSNLLPHRYPSNQYQLSLELVRRSIASSSSNSISQGNGIQSYGVQGSLQTTPPNRGARVRGQSHQLLRLATLLERHSDVYIGDSVSQRIANIRDRRSRLLSEVRNVLGLLRRGEDPRFEDLILEQAVFLGTADVHDRHRDMRLDVDNMSYEELLALEERIGNVSTGLSEESILKCLKQWTYLLPLEEGSPDAEPCCICQEAYVEGEEMGILDCGHEFHTACIKQWLRLKNLCPICKKAVLVT